MMDIDGKMRVWKSPARGEYYDLRDRSLFMWGGGWGVAKLMGWTRPIFFREKGWAKREFRDGWEWVIVCFVKNHTHYNSCGRSK